MEMEPKKGPRTKTAKKEAPTGGSVACSQPSIFSLGVKPAHRGSREIWTLAQKDETKGEGRRGARKIQGLGKSEFSVSPETENSHWSNVGKPDITLVTINYSEPLIVLPSAALITRLGIEKEQRQAVVHLKW